MRWRLWRQDDNGNRFLIAEFESPEAAERRMEELSRYPHKQMYWIEEGTTGKGEETGAARGRVSRCRWR